MATVIALDALHIGISEWKLWFHPQDHMQYKSKKKLVMASCVCAIVSELATSWCLFHHAMAEGAP